MGWKQFIVELISSVAWPAVAAAFLFSFKSELAKIIQRLAHLKYKDLELDFEKLKEQAEEIHHAIEKETIIESNPTLSSLEEQVLDAVEKAPSAAILLAWSGLEAAMASTVSRLAISPESPSYRSPMHNIDMLKKYGALSKNHIELLHELRMLRNKVAHEKDIILSISQKQAQDYANAAIDMVHYLEHVEKNG